jgi:tRNA pseudouridine32 synthase/23S rRNA pseudouridine746 synthase
VSIAGVEVLGATARMVVVNKPAGMLSVPGKAAHNKDCVVARVRQALPAARGPIVVHRLDMDTSGLLVLALDEEAQRDLSRQFEERTVEKAYEALLEGRLAGASGVIDAPMRADLERRPVQIVDHEQGRPSRTEWRVLGYEPGRTRVTLRPTTGRTHQLRVHVAHVGHPIVGDVLYGRAEREAGRLMLHATRLVFNEPVGGERVEFRSAAPF